jgi:hypothetical protein
VCGAVFLAAVFSRLSRRCWLGTADAAATAAAACCCCRLLLLLLQGEYISVEKLEAIYKKSPSVEQVRPSAWV